MLFFGDGSGCTQFARSAGRAIGRQLRQPSRVWAVPRTLGLDPAYSAERCSIVLERQPGADTAGNAGLEDEADNHWRELLKAAALSTLLGAATEIGPCGTDNDIIRALRRGAGDTLNQTGQQVVRRNLNIQQTLTIRPGFPVRVMIGNFSKTTRPAPRRLVGGKANIMIERKFREQEVQIARYRLLKREVTDPLAACLLHIIILELEADLRKNWEIGQGHCQGNNSAS